MGKRIVTEIPADFIFTPDADPADRDWAKRTWDIYYGDHIVTTLPDLFKELGHYMESTADRKEWLTEFLTYPSAMSAPETLQHYMDAFLEGDVDQDGRRIT